MTTVPSVTTGVVAETTTSSSASTTTSKTTTSTTAAPATTRVTAAPTTAAAARAATRPLATSAPATTAAQSGCHPSYEGACVPVASDVDCAGGSGNGPAYVSAKRFRVVGPDEYGLDSDNDGIACES